MAANICAPDGQHAMKIFLPRQCLNRSHGLLLGCVDEKHSFCCVTGMLSLSVKNDHQPQLQKSSDDDSICFGTVATFENDHDSGDHKSNGNGLPKPLLQIQNSSSGKLSVKWNANSEGLGRNLLVDNFVLIIYDAEQFSQSVFMETDAERQDACILSNTDIIKKSFELHRQCKMCHLINQHTDFTMLRMSQVTHANVLLFNFVVQVVSFILSVVSWVSSQRLFHCSVLTRLLSIPAMCNHVRQKFNITSMRLKSVTISRKHQLAFTSCIWLHLLDVVVGLTLMIWLLHDDKTTIVARSLLSVAETVATELEQLLQWMMGVPAGLKLNQPLAQFLGKFFLYHIFLWKAYLKALEPFAAMVLSSACLTGILGVSVLLTVVQDILSMMTLHIYCFYVYAARLYNLQMYALSSLWRLFRGKKRNVLRNRVDSAVYDIDQLFLGTLLFTILLFLLPTTALFYTVFALLRVIILVIQGILFKTVDLISSLPVYWLVLWLFRSDAVSGNIHVSVGQHSPLCLQLQLKPVFVAVLYHADASITQLVPESRQGRSSDADNTWKNLLHKLLFGQLIYPWISTSP
jgi:phosphatidylinositol glycan class Q protein